MTNSPENPLDILNPRPLQSGEASSSGQRVEVVHRGRSKNIPVRRRVAAGITVLLVAGGLWALNRGEDAYAGPARVDETGLCLEGVIKVTTELNSANAIAIQGMNLLDLNPEDTAVVNEFQTAIQFNGGTETGGPLPDTVLTAGDIVYLDRMCKTEGPVELFTYKGDK